MLAGAALAGGVSLLAGAAWLVGLLSGLSVALGQPVALVSKRRIAAGASLLAGVAAPLVVLYLILPVVAQLQGSLTPYGDINIWPWVGLAASDAAHTQVTTLPSLALALLMLVLCALVYVVGRLREGKDTPSPLSGMDDGTARPHVARGRRELARALRTEVPWLGLLLGRADETERRPGEPE
jgi:hypothetical protein